jgi:O-antigen/teichoic acid export membrane protein
VTKFLRDGGLLFAAESLARLAAFVVTFLVARRLGLHEVALLTLGQSLMAYATVAGDGGLGTGAVTRLVRGGNVPDVIKGTARLQVSLTVIACLVLVPVTAAAVGWALALVLAFTPVAIAASTQYVLQARRDVRAIATGRISGNLSTAVIGATAAFSHAPLWVVACAYPVGAIVTMLLVNRAAPAPLRLTFGVPSVTFLRSDWRHSLGLFGYTLSVHVYASILLLLAAALRHGDNLVEVALATRLLLLFSIPTQVLESVLLPRYAALAQQLTVKRIVRDSGVAFVAGVVFAAALIVAAPLYVPLLFGPDASGSVGTVQAAVLQVPISLVTSVLTVDLLARRRSAGLTVAYMVAAAVQAGLAVWFASSGAELMVQAIVWSELVLAVVAGGVALLRKRGTEQH